MRNSHLWVLVIGILIGKFLSGGMSMVLAENEPDRGNAPQIRNWVFQPETVHKPRLDRVTRMPKRGRDRRHRGRGAKEIEELSQDPSGSTTASASSEAPTDAESASSAPEPYDTIETKVVGELPTETPSPEASADADYGNRVASFRFPPKGAAPTVPVTPKALPSDEPDVVASVAPEQVTTASPKMPFVMTNFATDIIRDMVTLHGMVVPFDNPKVAAFFEYGTTEGRLESVTARKIVRGERELFGETLVDLTRGTTYFYRACVEWGDGKIAYGQTLSFTTEVVDPKATPSAVVDLPKTEDTKLSEVTPAPKISKKAKVKMGGKIFAQSKALTKSVVKEAVAAVQLTGSKPAMPDEDPVVDASGAPNAIGAVLASVASESLSPHERALESLRQLEHDAGAQVYKIKATRPKMASRKERRVRGISQREAKVEYKSALASWRVENEPKIAVLRAQVEELSTAQWYVKHGASRIAKRTKKLEAAKRSLAGIERELKTEKDAYERAFQKAGVPFPKEG